MAMEQNSRLASRRIVGGIAVAILATLPPAWGGSPPLDPFVPAPIGCAMAHCDPRMSDAVGLEVPTGKIALRWRDETASGANYGLGCASNGKVVACSLGGNFGGRGPFLKVYDALGHLLWTSDLLDFWSWTSAPMVDAAGGVIAVDDRHAIRFGPGGEVSWRAETPGGLPVSPVVTENGTLILATLHGPIAAFDSRDGTFLGERSLPGSYRGLSGAFETRNTPSVDRNRIYVLTEFRRSRGANPPRRPARLYAIDVEPQRTPPLSVAWYFTFGARSGSSPLFIDGVIYFDGDRIEPEGEKDPHFFAVRDQGDHGELLWRVPMPGEGFASAARDPRGGIWVFGYEAPWLLRLHEESGEILQRIDLGAMIDAPVLHTPFSVMSIAKGKGGPVMLVTASAIGKTAFGSHELVALDLVTETPLWRFRYGFTFRDWAAGQFPIVETPEGEPVVVFTTFANGVIALSALPEGGKGMGDDVRGTGIETDVRPPGVDAER